MTNLTTIQLVTSGGTEIGYLDITEDGIIPITYSIGDIRDISKKNGTFSKSIKFKGTKLNNILFNNYFDVNITADSTTFDINRKQFCRILQNGVAILDNAVIQLIQVTKQQNGNNYDEQIEYTCLVKDTAGDFFSLINNHFLDELDTTIRPHTFNAQTVINSFSNTINNGYKYVMCYNPANSTDSAYTSTYPIFRVEEFKPAIYARLYFDAIFNSTPYSYKWDSENYDSIRFDNLLIPYNGDSIISDNINSQFTVNANSTGTQSIKTQNIDRKVNIFTANRHVFIGSTKNVINVTNETLDANGNYNPITSTYTTPNLPSNNNYVTYTYSITYQINVNNPNGYNVHFSPLDLIHYDLTLAGDCSLTPHFCITDSKGVDTPLISQSTIITKGQNFNPNFNATIATNTISGSIDLKPIDANKTLQLTASLAADVINCKIGNAERVFTKDNISLENNVTIELLITNVTLTITSKINGTYGYGSTIDFYVTHSGTTGNITKTNPFAPKQVKQSDFIKGILTMFNLYVETDKDNSLLLNIYRRDDYYDNGKNVDWTQKFVKNNEQDIIFLPELKNKKELLTYKQDNDFANQSYEDNVSEVYGQYVYTFDNEYVKDVDKTELLFSPTPMINLKFGAVVPMMDGEAPKNNIRILYDGYTQPCSPFVIENFSYSAKNYTSIITSGFSGNAQFNDNLGNTYANATNRYPFISHQDKPIAPNYDLNFGECDFYYRNDNWFPNTNNNLFNLHWIRTLNNINSGKMLVGYFALNENDIANMKLSDRILVNNCWWHINQIIDYDANSNNPVKVELISIDDSPLALNFGNKSLKPLNTYTPQIAAASNWLNNISIIHNNNNASGGAVIIGGGTGNIIPPSIRLGNIFGSDNYVGGMLPAFITGNANILNNGGNVVGDNNYIQDANNFIWGNNNQLTGTTSNKNYLMGSNNNLESDVNSSFILGNNNTVKTGSNGNIILGNNIIASGFNTTYANNIQIISGGTFSIGDTVFNQPTLQLTSAALSTGLYIFSNNGITLNTTTTFNLGNVVGWIIDSRDALNANPTYVNYSGASGLTTPYLNTSPATYLMINTGSTLVMLNTRPTATQRRDNIYLGAIGHPNSIINVIGNQPDIIMNEMAQVRAMFEPIRLINDGIVPYANSTDLSLANTAGILYGFGIGFIANGNLSPTAINISAGAPTTFQYRTQTKGFGASTTLIDPTQYDVAGNNTPIGGGSNSATNQRIYLLEDGEIRAQLGQTIYSNLAAAINAVQTEPYITFPNNKNIGILIGILSIQKNCTNLSDTSKAQFLGVSKFGESVGAGAGVSTGTLQTAYNNSGNPEIITNANNGGFQIQRGSASDNDNVFVILNGSAAQKAAIDGNGNISGTSLNVATNGASACITSTNSSGNDNADFINTVNAGSGSAAVYASVSTSSVMNYCFQANIYGTRGNILFGYTTTGTDEMVYLLNSNTTTPHSPTLRVAHNNGIGVLIESNYNNDAISIWKGATASGNYLKATGANGDKAWLNSGGTWTSQGYIKQGGTNVQSLMADGSVSTLQSATYTPTYTNVANVTSFVPVNASYLRIGNIVQVVAGFNVTVTTANVDTRFTITLPFTRANLSYRNIGNGTASDGSNAFAGAAMFGQTNTTTTIQMYMKPLTNGTLSATVTFQYNVAE